MGLLSRGKLPDIVLDEAGAKWYEKAAAGTTGALSDLPAMIAGGAMVGAMTGGATLETGPGAAIGAAMGVGAGAMAMPTLIRESLMQAYAKGDVTDARDFLSRVGIVAKATTRDAIIGALSAGTGVVAGRAVAPSVARAIEAGSIGATTGKALQYGATMIGEDGVMTFAPAALEGRLPDASDFAAAAVMTVGMRGAHLAYGTTKTAVQEHYRIKMAKNVEAKLRDIYAKAGIAPEEVYVDAMGDPALVIQP